MPVAHPTHRAQRVRHRGDSRGQRAARARNGDRVQSRRNARSRAGRCPMDPGSGSGGGRHADGAGPGSHADSIPLDRSPGLGNSGARRRGGFRLRRPRTALAHTRPVADGRLESKHESVLTSTNKVGVLYGQTRAIRIMEGGSGRYMGFFFFKLLACRTLDTSPYALRRASKQALRSSYVSPRSQAHNTSSRRD